MVVGGSAGRHAPPPAARAGPPSRGAATTAAGIRPPAGAVVNGTFAVVDGNEAAAYVAHKTSEVIAIYPITPSSAMAELADAWSAASHDNIWGTIPRVIQMQSEAGAAGAVHGALQAGALTTTFTASQGLLLMIPNMFKIAGELTPAVFHVAARAVATHALSIFGDHSDVMAVRGTGWGMLCSASVQEAQDFALIATAATLRARVPYLHFFDGFRTSHELNKITLLCDDTIRALIPDELVAAHRARRLTPDAPVIRGTAQNPDVFFQSREAANPYYAAAPAITREVMDEFARLTGRRYRLFDYVGDPAAERVLVVLGSAAGAIEEAIEALNARGEKVGLLKVRLFRPFSVADFVTALPATTRSIAVLDRTKEPGAVGEPLYTDIVAALSEAMADGSAPFERQPRVIGVRYGLASKEFTPAMAAGAFAELARERPRPHATVGIIDDVSGLSIDYDPAFDTDTGHGVRAVFYALGSDGTVGANKNTAKIIGDATGMYPQGYFVYDSKKSGTVTVSHLRFSHEPVRSTYLVQRASFVACHQFHLLDRVDVLELADHGATFLLNSPHGPEGTWDRLPREVQERIIERQLRLFVVDASRVAKEAGLGNRINTVLQVCFFALADVLPQDQAIAAIKDAIQKTYGKRGATVLERNFAAVDAALHGLHEVCVPAVADGSGHMIELVPAHAPAFVKDVTCPMIAGRGDALPVSALPADGTFPTGTTQWEKRGIAAEIPVWDPSICIECAKCALVCPHAAIRMKVYDGSTLLDAPDTFQHMEWSGKDAPGSMMTIQVAPDDCTGCGICVDVCPARSKSEVKHKSINMAPAPEHRERERANWAFFEALPERDRTTVNAASIKGSQMLQPLFEFSGACAGCGETPYLKLLTQLFGDRLLIANATGCSSIYGGNLPTTPWRQDDAGRGPAWSNSLFEDNAEFGLGMRLAVEQQTALARRLLHELAPVVGEDLAQRILQADQSSEPEIAAQRERVHAVKQLLAGETSPEAHRLLTVADNLVEKSIWIVGGDGWAYDIGFSGLDHVLASGKNVNILVLDTEVYSNTGGQASKSTSRGAVAKFAAAGKRVGKKDLGMIAAAYGNTYVAKVALGADNMQTIRAFAEAEAYDGPSLIIAYSTCIAHGIDMSTSMTHQRDAVLSGYWPLFRYKPNAAEFGERPFQLDSKRPSLRFRDFALKEARFGMLQLANPDEAEQLLAMAQDDIDERWRLYEQVAGVERHAPQVVPEHEDLAARGDEQEEPLW
ncbi:MAG: pyruvate:ferredoxin (flavodoxin) oxidoreductase [Dehalococcoidia bacterium]|nr:pyruvate:ferredoxin (flavodoxin) oxidoreductase [Dehalococcoidia bacterium]